MSARNKTTLALTLSLLIGGLVWMELRSPEPSDRQLSNQSIAELQVAAIQIAIQEYEARYGRLPIVSPQTDQNNATLFPLLSGTSIDVNGDTLNPDHRNFLRFGWQNWIDGELCDPWNSPYRVLMDHDGDGQLFFDLAGNRSRYGVSPHGMQRRAEYAVMSIGANLLNDGGLYDDICDLSGEPVYNLEVLDRLTPPNMTVEVTDDSGTRTVTSQ